jgi:hypothetical protein
MKQKIAHKQITLKLGCWNCSGIYGNYIYVMTLLRESADIFAICEHWLYPDELIFLDSLNDDFRFFHKVAQIII